MKKSIVLSTIAAVATSLAIASEPVERDKDHQRAKLGQMMMKKMDTDNDHQISLQEFTQFHKQRFEKMDANNDGYVTPEEAKAHHQSVREKWRQRRQEAESNASPET